MKAELGQKQAFVQALVRSFDPTPGHAELQALDFAVQMIIECVFQRKHLEKIKEKNMWLSHLLELGTC